MSDISLDSTISFPYPYPHRLDSICCRSFGRSIEAERDSGSGARATSIEGWDDDATSRDPDEETEPEPAPALTLSAGTIVAGGDITVSGTGFEPGQQIAFELHSDPIALGTLTADAGGVLKGSFKIPASAPAGAHTLVALSGTTVVATAALSVTAAGSPGSGGATTGGTGGALASTGSDAPIAAAMAGLMLLVAGLTLVRRRRVHS